MACEVIHLPRSSWYYVSHKTANAEVRIIEDFLRDYVARRPRRGFSKCFTRSRRMGYAWNHKRVYRIYKQLGLNLRRRVKHRLPERVKQALVAPASPNTGWSMDFMSDRLVNGRQFRTLNLIDEFNREALAIEVDTSMPSARVIRVLEQVKSWRALPQSIRVDNGPEFIAFELTEWLSDLGAETYHIDPGKPWQNGFVESFHNRLRDECLNCEEFWSVEHARVVLESWRHEYNTEHLHSSLGYATPAEFAAAHRRPAVLVPA